MKILGKDKNDKGQQLEELVKSLIENSRLLEDVKNVSVGKRRFTNSGGEIDVEATVTLRINEKTETKNLIVECKAYQGEIMLPDWHKFLGKILEKKFDTQKEWIGWFVALNGVNSKINSWYNNFKTTSNSYKLRLLTGEDLQNLMHSSLHCVSEEFAIREIFDITNREYTYLELLYYNKKTYWFIKFDNNEYSVLDQNAQTFKEELDNEIKRLVEETYKVNNYIDLWDEWNDSGMVYYIQAEILCTLFERNTSLSIDDIKNEVKDLYGTDPVEDVVLQMKGDLIKGDGNNYMLKTESDFEQRIEYKEYVIQLFKLIYNIGNSTVVEKVIPSPLYKNFIKNNVLVSFIQDNLSGFISGEHDLHINNILQYSVTGLKQLIDYIDNPQVEADEFQNKLCKALIHDLNTYYDKREKDLLASMSGDIKINSINIPFKNIEF
ncbi:hypothetical protein [Priestia megaterium]|uniref:hypothetical protein n=1 Tax=Priestia megaterium TaxID=1404 RepID=UPI002E1BE140|nr:hypothetical protein [Priestia megaterium]